MKKYFREWTVVLVLGLVLLILGIAAPAFFELQPSLSRLARESPALVVVCGVTLVMICRQIDISVGSQFAVCSVCGGLLAAAGYPLPVVISGWIAAVL